MHQSNLRKFHTWTLDVFRAIQKFGLICARCLPTGMSVMYMKNNSNRKSVKAWERGIEKKYNSSERLLLRDNTIRFSEIELDTDG